MKKHLRVLRTLFVKDIVDMFKNPNVLLMLALPLIFIVIYQFVDLGMSPAYLLMLGVMMNLCLTPLSVLGMMIAEEKEKNTMRTLMLCNVTGGEFLAAKTLAVLAGTLLVDTVLFFLTGFGPAQLPVFLLVCTAGSITMLLLGGLTGIDHENGHDQMAGVVLQVKKTVFKGSFPKIKNTGHPKPPLR